MRQTKIVGTIGPASETPDVFKLLVDAGLDVVRFNFSHGNHDTHKKNMDLVKEVREEKKIPLAILMDTKGPEIRVKTMEDKTVLIQGEEVLLESGDFIGNKNHVPITYEELYKDVVPGNVLLINDGKIHLEVLEVLGESIRTKVVEGGLLQTRKGMNAPGIRVNLPAVTEQDEKDIAFAISQDVDFIAASFIRRAEDVLSIRRFLDEHGGDQIQIISKIENREGYHNLEEILDVSDGIMVARGDLGMEMPIEEIPLAQKRMIEVANHRGKIVITATQMLESMTQSPLPTRAEATDVANAIIDGTDAIMLSGEMAAGQFPVEAVRMMDRIAKVTESSLEPMKLDHQVKIQNYMDNVTYAVSRSSVETATLLDAKAILTATSSGFTARKIAMNRPKCIIMAATTSERVRRQLMILRGVVSFPIGHARHTDELFQMLEAKAVEEGLVTAGDIVVITCGIPIGVAGATNMIKVQAIGEITVKGVGIGKEKTKGVIRMVDESPETFKDGDIIYTRGIDESMSDIVRRAGGIITSEAGFTSIAAIAAVNLKIPAILGVKGAEYLFYDGLEIIMDAKLGIASNSDKFFEE